MKASGKGKIWIDLGNSPHVPFFLALAEEFTNRGYEVIWTARDYAQTVEMARLAGLDPEVFGTHGGKDPVMKVARFTQRTAQLLRWARGRQIVLAVSHNSLEPLAAAKFLGIPSVNLMDYEHHPNNHISFRLARRVIVPESFPAQALERFGATGAKTHRFPGIKEDVYLASFRPDPNFKPEMEKLGVVDGDILVVVRPHAPEALYNRNFENELLDALLDRLASISNVRVVLLPRKDSQGQELRRRHPQPNIILPETALDGANLIASADLVISGGGTMNREAAALGVPAATIFTGQPAAIDEYLYNEGRLMKIGSLEDIQNLRLVKKGSLSLRAKTEVRSAVADLILGSIE